MPGGYSTSASPNVELPGGYSTSASVEVPGGYSTSAAAVGADLYGQLPLAPSTRSLPLEKRAFFRPLTRSEAEAVLALQPNGSFLLRPSSQPDAKCTLSHRSFDGSVGHALVFLDDSGWSLEGTEGVFSTVDDLLLSLPLLHDKVESK